MKLGWDQGMNGLRGQLFSFLFDVGNMQTYCGPTLFYCASLYQASQMLYFSHIKGLWQPCLEPVHWCHFPQSICSLHVFVS